MNIEPTGLPVTSPNLPVDSGIVYNPKQFSDALTLDLTDEEIKRALQICLPIRKKWQERFRSKLRHQNFTVDEAMKLVDQLEDELVYELATRADLIATVDASPVFEGQPPIIEFVGALPGHISATHGLDHERKQYEVRKAKDVGESFLGESQLDE